MTGVRSRPASNGMYHFYHTPSFVLSAQDVSEGSRMLSLFTRELGLVRVHARSVREERSKLRGYLQPLSFAQVALVRGRDLWRLTTAGLAPSPQDSLVYKGVLWRHKRSIVYIARILERHLQGEERDAVLYDCFRDGVHALANCDHGSTWESLMLARLLSQLGYGHVERIDARLAENIWDESALATAVAHESELVCLIQMALAASQL